MSMETEQAAAIAAIWRRQVPQTRERLALLERVAAELAETRTMEPGLRAEALDVAHKLAGSMGMFGYWEATEQARLVHAELEREGLPQPERLEEFVKGLCGALAGALVE